MSFTLTETQYGFKWGPMDVSRSISDPKFGVVITIKTPRETLYVRSTPTGLIRVDQNHIP